MKQFIFLTLSFLYINCCFCQDIGQRKDKRPIDSSDYDKWPAFESCYISNDGKYISYTIDKQPPGGATSVLKSTQNSWETITGGYGLGISADSRKAIYKRPNDSLAIMTLGTDSVEIIAHVKVFNFITNGENRWLIYYLRDIEKKIFVRNLRTGGTISIDSVADYFSSNDGDVLIIRKERKREGKIIQLLEWMDLRNGNQVAVWEGTGMAGSFVFDKSFSQLAFFVEDSVNGQPQKSIWYYKSGTGKADKLVDRKLLGTDDSEIGNPGRFSEDGNRLFVMYKNVTEETKNADPNAVQVDIWSHTDTKLQSHQLADFKNPFSKFYATLIIRIKDRGFFKLTQPGEVILGSNDHFALVIHPDADADPWESNWNPACRYSVFLVSSQNGSRKMIKEHTLLYYTLSPEGKYVIWYDPKQKNYFSLELSTGIPGNITKSITDWSEGENSFPDTGAFVNAISGWLKGDSAVLLHDQNDIWQVDLSGDHPPINLTNGYGRKHDIVFRLAGDEGNAILSPGQMVLLSAFNRSTKDNGFYNMLLSVKKNPDSLTMGPYVYEVPGNKPSIDGPPPLKARDAESYLVRRMSATESPNYFYTTDFKNFTQISNVHPEREVNWLTTELITWKTLDGTISQGVLYKPENFDPTKKYPIIFYYYERVSDRLNEFEQPEYSAGCLDIPTYVSNGYLVFTPDIHYKIGEPGQSALNSIVSAGQYLSRKLWVDSTRMGLQGHSFGGYETNYVITHSHLFAAACSASGLSDFISDYGGLIDDGSSEEAMFERMQFRIGTSLWQNPDLYIKNSPIFQADKVTTPLLMMHTTDDGIIAFSNAVEFFTGLRRLDKKVWMLQYDNNNHSVIGNAGVDFTIRMQQFFDHYLKGAPMPRWMKEGIPAKLKGIERGLELDNNEKN